MKSHISFIHLYHKKPRILAGLLTCLFLFTFIFSLVPLETHAATSKTVVIAYNSDSPMVSFKDGIYQGYAVDYFEELSTYTKWDYQYVKCSWNNAMIGLRSGSIDFVVGAQATEDRLETYLYSEIPLLEELSYLYVASDNFDICYEEFSAMDGLTIGFLTGATMLNDFTAYAEEHGFTFTPKMYQTTSQFESALSGGEIDAFTIDNLHFMPDYKIVGQFGFAPSYIISGKKNASLMEQLNSAMLLLKHNKPSLISNLYTEYFLHHQTSSAPLYTRTEYEFVHAMDPITIGFYTNFTPLSFEKDGEVSGILPFICQELSNFSGIPMKFVPLDDEDGLNSSDLTSVDFIAGIGLSDNVVKNPFYQYTQPVYYDRFVLVSKENRAFSSKEHPTVSIPVTYNYVCDYVEENYLDSTVLKLKSPHEALHEVVYGDADFSLLNQYVASYEMGKPEFSELHIFSSDSFVDETVLLTSNSTSQITLDVLNKAIAQMNYDVLYDDVERIAKSTTYSYNVVDLWDSHQTEILSFLVMIVAFIIILYRSSSNLTKLAKMRKEKEHYQALAQSDAITKLFNYTSFTEKAGELLAKNTSDISYVMLDININNFKQINEIYNYTKGNDLLIFIASLLKSVCEKHNGICGRLESHRFALLLPNNYEIEELIDMEILQPLDEYPLDCRMDIQIGAYYINNFSLSVDNICNYAHFSTYMASISPGKRFHVFDEKFMNQINLEKEIVENMAFALESGQFEVYIQPKNRLDTGEIFGGEALVRWRHPIRGNISPGIFIPIFEKHGFITKLDLYMLDQTCAFIKTLMDEKKKCVPISVNFSPLDFNVPNAANVILNIIDKHDILREYIQIELKETAYLSNQNMIKEQLITLQHSGIKLIMDDLGRELSSFYVLKESPVNILKLDLLTLIQDDPYSRGSKITNSIVNLAKDLNIDLIVEGIESEQQAQFLRSLKCTEGQGYYFAKPMPAKDFFDCLNP